MTSRSGDDDAGCSSRVMSHELQARDLPSKRLLGKGLASVAYETEWNGKRVARKDFIGVPSSSFRQEASILVDLEDHENVVKTHGWAVGKLSCSLVLEYVEEDLLDLLQKRKESLKRPTGIASGSQSERSHSYTFYWAAAALDMMDEDFLDLLQKENEGLLDLLQKRKESLERPTGIASGSQSERSHSYPFNSAAAALDMMDEDFLDLLQKENEGLLDLLQKRKESLERSTGIASGSQSELSHSNPFNSAAAALDIMDKDFPDLLQKRREVHLDLLQKKRREVHLDLLQKRREDLLEFLQKRKEDLLDLLQKRRDSLERPTGIASGSQSERSHPYPFMSAEALDIMDEDFPDSLPKRREVRLDLLQKRRVLRLDFMQKRRVVHLHLLQKKKEDLIDSWRSLERPTGIASGSQSERSQFYFFYLTIALNLDLMDENFLDLLQKENEGPLDLLQMENEGLLELLEMRREDLVDLLLKENEYFIYSSQKRIKDLLDLLQKRIESRERPTGIASGSQSEPNYTYPFDLAEALDIIIQIARGMEFLHAHHISHGDLKTKNILVTHTNDGDKKLLSVKVADFGLVRTKSRSMPFVSRQARKLDMVQWQAPEILERLLSEDNEETSSESDSDPEKECAGPPRVIDGRAADVYSFAVTCSQILTGKDPYPIRNWKELGPKIVSGELRPNVPTGFSPFLKEILESCWRKIPAERPTFSAILALLDLQYDPDLMDLMTPQLLPEYWMKPEFYRTRKEKRRVPTARLSGLSPTSRKGFPTFAAERESSLDLGKKLY